MVTSPLWAEFQRQEAAKQTRPQAFGDAAAAYSNPGTKQVATSPLIRAAATAPKPPTVPLMQFAQSQQVQQSPAAPTNRVPLMQAAGIQPFSSQSDVRRVDNAISAASAPSSTVSSTSAPRSLIDAAREVAPGIYNHGRGQYSDNPKGMGLIAAAGLGGAQTTPGPAQRMGLVEMARQQSAPGSTAWSSADNATMAANLRDGVDLYRGTSQGTQNQPYTPPQDTGGYGLLDKNTRDLRNARLQAELMKPGARMALAGLLREQGSAADRMAQASEAAAGRIFQAGQNEADRGLKREGLAQTGLAEQARRQEAMRRLELEASDPKRVAGDRLNALGELLGETTDQAKRQQIIDQINVLRGGGSQANAPAGYRWTANGQSMEAIPGGPAAAKQAEEQRTRDSANDQTRQIIGTINRLQQHPGRKGATGMWNLGRMVPGSPASDFAAEVETLKAQTFLPMVQQLRGLGALSNAEGDKLNAAVGALRFDMSEEAFNQSLGRIRDQFGAALARAGIDTGDMQSWGLNPQGGQQAAPAGEQGQQRTVRRTGTMNGRRVVEYSDGSISYAD